MNLTEILIKHIIVPSISWSLILFQIKIILWKNNNLWSLMVRLSIPFPFFLKSVLRGCCGDVKTSRLKLSKRSIIVNCNSVEK